MNLVLFIVLIVVLDPNAVQSLEKGELIYGTTSDTKLPSGGSIMYSQFIDMEQFNYLGTKYSKVKIDSHGAVVLQSDSSTTYLSPFFSKVDTRIGGDVWYRKSDSNYDLGRYSEYIKKASTFFKDFSATDAFIATWDDVACTGFNPQVESRRNTYQVALLYNETETYVVFSYVKLEWPIDVTEQPGAGMFYNDSKHVAYAVPGSDTADVLKLAIYSNTEKPGMWVYRVSGTSIESGVHCNTTACTTLLQCKNLKRPGFCNCPATTPYEVDIRCHNKTDGQCPSGQMKCPKSKLCMPLEWKCNGHDDCGDNSDEQDCENYDCFGNMTKCGGSNGLCVWKTFRCDGNTNIWVCGGDGSDELNCPETGGTRTGDTPSEPGQRVAEVAQRSTGDWRVLLIFVGILLGFSVVGVARSKYMEKHPEKHLDEYHHHQNKEAEEEVQQTINLRMEHLEHENEELKAEVARLNSIIEVFNASGNSAI